MTRNCDSYENYQDIRIKNMKHKGRTVTMPVFVFARRRDIELESGFVLAGRLFLDEPKPTGEDMLDRVKRMTADIIQQLTAMARSGRMPDYAVTYGRPGGRRPPNADDITSNDTLMAAWARDRLIIEVRVDPRNDGVVRVDSGTMRQIGLVNEH